jgi:hypothetical protein
MSEPRLYLFNRLTLLAASITKLVEEEPQVRECCDVLQPHLDLDGVREFLSRRAAYLPSQLDGGLRELITVCQCLRELGAHSVRLTGSLSTPPYPLVPTVPAIPTRLDATDARPTRPKLATAKSASDLRPPTANPGHPALRQRTDAQSKFYIKRAGDCLT